MNGDLLFRILSPDPPPFALLHRPHTGGSTVDVVVGEASVADSTSGIPLPAPSPVGGPPRHDAVALLPFRQIGERGHSCVDDGAPLVVITVGAQDSVPLADVLRRLPDTPTQVTGGHFDPDDAAYEAIVRRVVDGEIGTGEGANFVIKRSYRAEIRDYTLDSALAVFGRLLRTESGAYWTHIVHTGDRTLVGASPERHISRTGGAAVMNPISGTYRYPPTGASLDGALGFLSDRKETEELYMVLDEELKMMARVCPDGGGRVRGPYLREMSRLAHTEYFIDGTSAGDPRDLLHATLLAPTVTGSPLENAFRVIRRHEPQGRGYYSGVLALIGQDGRGERTLDSSILIRTAEIDAQGRIDIGVGASLVRASVPELEAAETRAKAAGLLAAIEGAPAALPSAGAPAPGADTRVQLADDARIQAALSERNSAIAAYWMAGRRPRALPRPRPRTGRKVLVIDAEDDFTAMLRHQLSDLGCAVTVQRYDEPLPLNAYDAVVLGPGPGDPRALDQPRIAALDARAAALLARRHPFLAVCLSHQVLSRRLGLPLERRLSPNQGVQRAIDLFGASERAGFYNTYAAHSPKDKITCQEAGAVEVSRDPVDGEVHALRGNRFASLQFHPESVLTPDGVRIVDRMLRHAVGG
ncbi:anthranilate synthase family protein [Nocardiopsis coralliicola]